MAKKLSKAKRISEQVNADLHDHVFSNPRKPANTGYREGMFLIGNPRRKSKRGLQAIVNQMRKTGLDILGLTRAGDDYLPERIISQAPALPEDWSWYVDPKMAQVIDPQNQVFTFIPNEETFPKKGHVLVATGLQFGQQLQREGITFKEIKDYADSHNGVTIVSDHPTARGGLLKKGQLTPREIADSIDAYEWNASVDSIDNINVEAFERHNPKIPRIYSSDAHRIRDIGKASTRFKEIDSTNGEKLSESLNHAIKRGLMSPNRKHYIPLTGRAHHAYMVFTDHCLGFSKHDTEKDNFNLEEALEKMNLQT